MYTVSLARDSAHWLNVHNHSCHSFDFFEPDVSHLWARLWAACLHVKKAKLGQVEPSSVEFVCALSQSTRGNVQNLRVVRVSVLLY